MNEICAKCKKIIAKGETSIASVKNLKKSFYHARCFGATYLENDKDKEEVKLPKK